MTANIRKFSFLAALLAALGLAACEQQSPALDSGTDAAASRPAQSQGAAASADANQGDKIFDMPYVMRELDNGLRVIIVKTDYPDIVNMQMPVQSGSRNEFEPGKSGFAHFFEHMMFRGTENYTADEYGAILKNAGADQNAYTTDDYTNYHVTFTKPDLETVIALEADRFMNLKYSEEEFRTEALAVKGEYLKNASNPVRKWLEAMRNIAFDVHTYKHTTMGFLEDIEDMPNQLEYSYEFFDRWYRPEKSAVIIVGDVDPEATFDLVKEHFGPWERGSYEPEIPVEPAPDGPIYQHIQWDVPGQPWLAVAFRGPAFNPDQKDMPAMDLISQVYFSENSEVYQKLVIEEQLVDQFWSWFPDRKDPYLLTIAARLIDPANADKVRAAIYETIAKARSETVDADKLEAIKSRLRYGFVAQMDNSESIGSTLASFVQFNRTPETINQVYGQYAAITPDDLVDYANRYFVDDGRVVVTLANQDAMPDFEADESIDALAAAAKTGDGVDVAFVEMPSDSSPLIDVAFLFNTGAAFDPPGKKGLAALTAAMITDGGSQKKSIAEINEAFFPIAAGFFSQVDKEMVRLSGSVHKDNLDTWYKLATQQLLTPGWRESDFDRLKTQAINGIKSDLIGNNDEELGKEVLYEYIYGNFHPYGSLNLGHISDLESITLDDVKAFYAANFTPANLAVGLAGGYTASLKDRLSNDLQKLPSAPANTLSLPAPPDIDGHQARIVQKETSSVAVSFGFPIDIKRGDPDWVALWLARSWLGEHRSSNSYLYQRIREARGMNYGDYAYIEYFPNGMFRNMPAANNSRQQQIFQVWLRPLRSNNDAHFATRAALFELNKLITEGMSQEHFEATRNFLDKYVSLMVASQGRQLGYKLDSEYYGIPAFADYVRSALKTMTVDDVNRVVREQLQMDNIKFVFIANDAEDLRNRLVSNQPSPLEYNAPKPELEAEDAIIQVLEINLEPGDVSVISSEEIFR
ncbi:MAG: insulinase family protein [Gammaproteobacteria bacterium]|nr:insulinase family protein [Gammaproteobacteria bacterium]